MNMNRLYIKYMYYKFLDCMAYNSGFVSVTVRVNWISLLRQDTCNLVCNVCNKKEPDSDLFFRHLWLHPLDSLSTSCTVSIFGCMTTNGLVELNYHYQCILNPAVLALILILILVLLKHYKHYMYYMYDECLFYLNCLYEVL